MLVVADGCVMVMVPLPCCDGARIYVLVCFSYQSLITEKTRLRTPTRRMSLIAFLVLVRDADFLPMKGKKILCVAWVLLSGLFGYL